MKFRTKYNIEDEFLTEIGSTELVTPIYNEDGDKVDSDVTDLDAYIQSNSENGNVALILERYAVTGDDSYLNKSNGFYANVSGSQNMDFHERFYSNQAAIDLYNGLPDNVKEMYPTAEDFYNSVDGMRLRDLMSDDTVDDVINTIESEVSNE